MPHLLSYWIGFHVLILFLFACDFLIFHRTSQPMSAKKAWGLSAFWILVALIFNGLLYFTHGSEKALQFFTAYLVEKSLSIDNLFVFLMLFSQFSIEPENQHKILFWGIIGAIFFRITFILLGIQILITFHWMIYILGVFLCFTGIKLLISPHKNPDVERNFLVRCFSFLPLAKETIHSHFFVRENGRLKMTLLFLVLLIVESTDILFALDSIPAVLAITTDPLIAYTSNIFAIIGLRALFFAITPLLKKIRYLNWGLSAILIFIGVKMLLSGVLVIPLLVSLLVILMILFVTAILSF